MRFGELLGHDAPLRLLTRALAAERLPHALLFQGPDGVGKAAAARVLAAALLCEREKAEERPCDDCPACRKLSHGNHPDLLVVERLPKKGSSPEAAGEDPSDEEGQGRTDLRPFIVVGQIRELSAHAAYAPREGRSRVFIVDPADRMNHEAQNALLKTLEEPPGRSVLVLVASRPHLLLSTVRSRCLALRFAPMPVRDLAARLEARGFPPEESLARAAFASGRPGRALTLDPQGLRGRREEILHAIERLAAGPQALAELQGMVAAVAGSDEETLLEGLDLLETLLRDAALSGAGAPTAGLVHADLGPRLLRLGRSIGSSRASTLVRSVERLRGELRFNLNRTLVTETLLAAVSGGPLP